MLYISDPSPELSGEENLWVAVILRAFKDAVSKSSMMKQERRQARAWLLGDHPEHESIEDEQQFEDICNACGMVPQVVREEAQRMDALGWPQILGEFDNE